MSKLGAVAFTVLIGGAAAIAFALVAGLPYESAQRARDRELFPQVGRSVDIGGRALNIYCSGTGQPAVIFESGAPWPLSDPRKAFEDGEPRPGYSWVGVQRELAKNKTSCWYDRAGSGWSDLGPYPRDGASNARDLHALLRAAGILPPYVLVAEASAALDARVYAGSWPEDVAGLVFVNGVHPDLLIRTGLGRRTALVPAFVGHSQDEMAQLINQVGLYRFGLPSGPAPAPVPQGMTPSEWNTVWHLTQSSRARSALMQEIGAWQLSTDEARRAGSLGDRPLIVLSGENTLLSPAHHSVWVDLQNDLARLSTRGKVVQVDKGRDNLVYRVPDAVIAATRQVLDDARRATSAPGRR